MQAEFQVTRHPDQPCPYCGKTLNAATLARPNARRTPRQGDFTVCWGCLEPLKFYSTPLGLGLAKCTPEQLAQFAVDYGHVVEQLRERKAQT